MLIGPNAVWRERAAEHLGLCGFHVLNEVTVEDALRNLGSDVEIAVISDEGHEAEDFPAVSRMVRTLPTLRILLLTSQADIPTTMKYFQLGQRDGGELTVDCIGNKYNYEWLAGQIRDRLPKHSLNSA